MLLLANQAKAWPMFSWPFGPLSAYRRIGVIGAPVQVQNIGNTLGSIHR
jgi:hypothetical protein